MTTISSPRPPRRGRLAREWAALLLIGVCTATTGNVVAEPIAVKVLVINMFGLEATPWLTALAPEREIRVPGLSSDFPSVHCNADAVCEMTTGMGHANAAASTMAMLLSGLFDLRKTYFLIAGIAGIDPIRGTIGSAAWARYAVDTGIAHEIDAREMPSGWQDGYFGVLTDGPTEVPKLDYRTEVFRLDEALLQQALALSRTVTLEDSADVRDYRRAYANAPADRAPRVIPVRYRLRRYLVGRAPPRGTRAPLDALAHRGRRGSTAPRSRKITRR